MENHNFQQVFDVLMEQVKKIETDCGATKQGMGTLVMKNGRMDSLKSNVCIIFYQRVSDLFSWEKEFTENKLGTHSLRPNGDGTYTFEAYHSSQKVYVKFWRNGDNVHCQEEEGSMIGKNEQILLTDLGEEAATIRSPQDMLDLLRNAGLEYRPLLWKNHPGFAEVLMNKGMAWCWNCGKCYVHVPPPGFADVWEEYRLIKNSVISIGTPIFNVSIDDPSGVWTIPKAKDFLRDTWNPAGAAYVSNILKSLQLQHARKYRETRKKTSFSQPVAQPHGICELKGGT